MIEMNYILIMSHHVIAFISVYFDYFDYVYFVFWRLFCWILSRHARPVTFQGRCMNVVIQQINPPRLLRGPVE